MGSKPTNKPLFERELIWRFRGLRAVYRYDGLRYALRYLFTGDAPE